MSKQVQIGIAGSRKAGHKSVNSAASSGLLRLWAQAAAPLAEEAAAGIWLRSHGPRAGRMWLGVPVDVRAMREEQDSRAIDAAAGVQDIARHTDPGDVIARGAPSAGGAAGAPSSSSSSSSSASLDIPVDLGPWRGAWAASRSPEWSIGVGMACQADSPAGMARCGTVAMALQLAAERAAADAGLCQLGEGVSLEALLGEEAGAGEGEGTGMVMGAGADTPLPPLAHMLAHPDAVRAPVQMLGVLRRRFLDAKGQGRARLASDWQHEEVEEEREGEEPAGETRSTKGDRGSAGALPSLALASASLTSSSSASLPGTLGSGPFLRDELRHGGQGAAVAAMGCLPEGMTAEDVAKGAGESTGGLSAPLQVAAGALDGHRTSSASAGAAADESGGDSSSSKEIGGGVVDSLLSFIGAKQEEEEEEEEEDGVGVGGGSGMGPNAAGQEDEFKPVWDDPGYLPNALRREALAMLMAGSAAATARTLGEFWELACLGSESESGRASASGVSGGVESGGAQAVRALLQTRLVKADQGTFSDFSAVDLLGRLLWTGTDEVREDWEGEIGGGGYGTGEGGVGAGGSDGEDEDEDEEGMHGSGGQGAGGMQAQRERAVPVGALAQDGLESALGLDAGVGAVCVRAMRALLHGGGRVVVARLLWGDAFGLEKRDPTVGAGSTPGGDGVMGDNGRGRPLASEGVTSGIKVGQQPPLAWLVAVGAAGAFASLPLGVPSPEGGLLPPVRFMRRLREWQEGAGAWARASFAMRVQVQVLGALLGRASGGDAAVGSGGASRAGGGAGADAGGEGKGLDVSLGGAVQWPEGWGRAIGQPHGAARRGGGALGAGAAAWDLMRLMRSCWLGGGERSGAGIGAGGDRPSGRGSCWGHWASVGKRGEAAAASACVWVHAQLELMEAACGAAGIGSVTSGSGDGDEMAMTMEVGPGGVVRARPVPLCTASGAGAGAGAQLQGAVAIRRLGVLGLAATGGPLDLAIGVLEGVGGVGGAPALGGAGVGEGRAGAKAGTAAVCALHLIRAWLQSGDTVVDAQLFEAKAVRGGGGAADGKEESAAGKVGQDEDEGDGDGDGDAGGLHAGWIAVPRGRAMLPLSALQGDAPVEGNDGEDESPSGDRAHSSHLQGAIASLQEASKQVALLPSYAVQVMRSGSLGDGSGKAKGDSLDHSIYLQVRPTALLLRLQRALEAVLQGALDQGSLPVLIWTAGVAGALVRRVASRAAEMEAGAGMEAGTEVEAKGGEDGLVDGLVEVLAKRGEGARLLKALLWGDDPGATRRGTSSVTSDGEDGGLCRALLVALLKARQRLGLSLPTMEAIGSEYPAVGASAGQIGALVETGSTGGESQDEGGVRNRGEIQVPSAADAEAQVQGALRCQRSQINAPESSQDGPALWVLQDQRVELQTGSTAHIPVYRGKADMPVWLQRQSRLLTRTVLLEELARELQAALDASGATEVMGGL